MLRFFFMVGLLGYSAAFRLPETRLICLIALDYATFVVLYRVAQRWQARSLARDCRELIENYQVGDHLAKKLARYWASQRY